MKFRIDAKLNDRDGFAEAPPFEVETDNMGQIEMGYNITEVILDEFINDSGVWLGVGTTITIERIE